MLLNIQGFMKHKDEIEQLIIEYEPKMLCLTETHVTEEVNDFELKLVNYVTIRCDSNSGRTGGIITYIKQNISYEEITNVNKDGNVWISTIKLIGKYEGLTLCNIYHSPNKSDGRFIQEITEECERIIDNGRIMIVGDFNIDVSKNNHYTKRLLRNLSELGLKQYVLNPTRITKTSKTTIDLVFSNFSTKTKILLTPKISDHQIVNILLNGENSNIKDREILKRDYKKINTNMYIELFNTNIRQDKYDASISINQMANNYIKRTVDTLDELAPVVKKKVKAKWINKPWITNEIKIAQRNRDNAYTNARQTNKLDDWLSYKNERNKAVHIARVHKRQYYENKIDQNKTDSKKMWKEMKELIGTKRQVEEVEYITFKEEKCTKQEEICERFNKYFVTSIDDIIKEIGTEPRTYMDNRVEIKIGMFRRVEWLEVDGIIKNLENKKGTEEGITTEIMKLNWKANSKAFLTVINRSLETGICPEEWKTSLIIPIQKVKGSKKAEEYRPINILPIYEKIIEKIVHTRLIEYLEMYDIITENQSGFRKGISCEMALQKTLIQWREYMDKGEMIGVVFIDFKRAFETINRNTLMDKLLQYGIGGKVMEWIKSYLTNRKQKTKYQNCTSAEMIIAHGVPQGSVLGPLLFIIYINDIVNEFRTVKCNLFADDMILYVNGDNADTIEHKLNQELQNVAKYLRINSLKLNIRKTKFMLVRDHRKQIQPNRCNIKIDDEVIEEIKETKYLGIVIDENLSFNQQAEFIIKKVAKKVNFLYRINRYVSMYTRVTIYKTIVAPHFDYCNTIMVNFSKFNIQRLQKIQNRAMRAILRCDRYTPIKSMLEALCFMSIQQRIYYNTCILVYKIVNNRAPDYLTREIRLTGNDHNYNTRNRGQIEIKYCRKKTAEKSLTQSGVRMYNQLPNEIRNAETVNSFKRKLKEYVRDNVNNME